MNPDIQVVIAACEATVDVAPVVKQTTIILPPSPYIFPGQRVKVIPGATIRIVRQGEQVPEPLPVDEWV